MPTILITGGSGFIGSNFIPFFLKENKDVKIINIDKLTYAADVKNLEEVKNNKRYTFIEGDICHRNTLEEIFKQNKIDGIIHFAAESHVDNSIANPDEFIKTNIFGTYQLLETAKKFWLKSNNAKNNRFHHISTDEVYGALGESGYFTEETPYAPNSPYSASKASSDFLVRSYHHTYGLNVVTTNCSNNYGPKQHDEKLIPTVIRKAINGEPIPIYGNGKNVRDWLFVQDHCEAILLAFNNGEIGETYAIGGNNEFNNLYIANTICDILDQIMPKSSSYREQITYVEDRLGHDFRYAIDSSKIENELGWTSKSNFQESLQNTVNWYIEKYKNK